MIAEDAGEGSNLFQSFKSHAFSESPKMQRKASRWDGFISKMRTMYDVKYQDKYLRVG